MTGKTIEIIVDAKGRATVRTRGFAGPDCRAASDFIEKALGEKTGEKLTAEFYQGETVRQRSQTRG